MGAHIPYKMMKSGNKARRISPYLLPSPDIAAEQYRLNGGHITEPEQTIKDPVQDAIKISMRSRAFITIRTADTFMTSLNSFPSPKSMGQMNRKCPS